MWSGSNLRGGVARRDPDQDQAVDDIAINQIENIVFCDSFCESSF